MSAAQAGRDLFADLALEELAKAITDERASETERARAAQKIATRILDRQASRRQTIADGVRRHKVATALVGVALGTGLYFAISGRRVRRQRRELEEHAQQQQQQPQWLPAGGSWTWRPGP